MSKEFETGNYEYTVIDLHNHSAYSEEHPLTTFDETQILEYFEQVAKIAGKKVCFAITDHDTSLGAWAVYHELKNNKDKYPHVDFVPGMELNVSLEKVLTYNDKDFDNPSFVFKKCHILIHAKKGKEEEFFKRTYQYSEIAHKSLLYNGKYVNVGQQLLAARNKLCEVYDIRIPLHLYKDCINNGDFDSIRNNFIDQTLKYLSEHKNLNSNIFLAQEIDNHICKLFPNVPRYFNDFGYYRRFNILEINSLLNGCATICYAHPQTLQMKQMAQIPVKAFKGVDISSLNTKIQHIIREKLSNPNEFENGFFTQKDILHDKGILSDNTGIVKLQILHNQLLKHGIKVDGYELTSNSLKTKESLNNKSRFEILADVIVDKCHLLLNYGSDKHYNDDDKKQLISGEVDYYTKQKRTLENPYLKYNRLGRQLTNEENSFTIGIEYANKKSESNEKVL